MIPWEENHLVVSRVVAGPPLNQVFMDLTKDPVGRYQADEGQEIVLSRLSNCVFVYCSH
jgi:hypothetical protein